MTSTTSRMSCTTCQQAVGQFKCEGCLQTFCMKHVIEHRQMLNQQLDEIILEKDSIRQANHRTKNQQEFLVDSINRWEQKSIEKIRQFATKIREEVQQKEVIHSGIDRILVQDLQNLTKRIKKARINEDFFENDLQDWRLSLNQLRQQLETSSLTIDFEEDQTQPLIYRIRMNSSSSEMKSTVSDDNERSNSSSNNSNVLISNEKFEYCYGNAKIENNGRLITNGNDSFFGTEVRGKLEYSSDKYCLRFRIENNPSKILIFIGIISKKTNMGGNLFTNSSVYGWGDYNDYFLAGKRQKDDSDVFFTHTHEKDIIEFIIDCSTQKICYKNLRHQRRQVLSIDMDKCPFPWQLYISLGGRADQISLIDSSSTTTA